MKRFIIVLVICISTAAFAQENFSPAQQYIKTVAKTVGESMCIKNETYNMCFGKTLQAIAWQESSFGKHNIGDDGTSFGPFQIKLSTARRIIRHFKMKFFYSLLKNKKKLKSKLLFDPWFSARIAARYIKMNYSYGLRTDHWDPWVLTVSRYNGGNFNQKYLDKIVQKIKDLS
ncbi:MAG: transglycosylase SLT domain-containing protein [Bacteroidetes bacterium]|nr:transglycosylase SLT domain-containing protein [Bacteroidota bacterium]